MLESLVVVDSHHKVLSAWADLRRTLTCAPRLLTLDHHTDTSKPFRNYIRRSQNHNSDQNEILRKVWIDKIDYRNPQSVADAIGRLSNDEHIVTAIAADIISSAFVLAHNARDTNIDVYEEHKIICQAINENHNSVIESHILEDAITGFNKILDEVGEPIFGMTPYILDIDLDYFNTFKSMQPESDKTIRALAKNASLVTIATEPDYVRSCALDADLNSHWLLENLLPLIRN